MATKPVSIHPQPVLGIECGGTRTVALLADANNNLLKRLEAGAANLRLLTDTQLLRHFKSIARNFPRPAALGVGMAGMRTESDRKRILTATAKVWPHIPCVATDDLETALTAAGEQKKTCVLILSGTGSCCFGKNMAGKTAKVGGWGHILGDDGSGYDIGLRALKLAVSIFGRTGKIVPLGRSFLRALQLNDPDEFITWVQGASKMEIAALATDVFAAAQRRDKDAMAVLHAAALALQLDAIHCASRLAKPGEPVEFVFSGGNLLKQPRFAALLAKRLKEACSCALITRLQRESAWGAVELAKNTIQNQKSEVRSQKPANIAAFQIGSLLLSPTEQRNPRSMNLDKLPVAKAIELMLSEDEMIPAALRAERKQIERAINLIAQAFRRGGRLFYAGAGTSGRLGVLDASECPPTFRTPPEMVQAIIAGGQSALWKSVEGAEDDAAAGARAVDFRGIRKHDIIVGIAASGRTPFVWGAMDEAKRRGAKTVLLCFNPSLKISRAARPDVVIAPDVGAEVLTGSTRLKAGTATKLVLNIFTTLAMVRLGKVAGNLMVDLNPSNVKLRDRAVRIVQELSGPDAISARTRLEKSGWVVKRALAAGKS